ncbi:MAG: hypothetical protein AAF623_18940, partial [Planctomycetota bacterium]
GRMLKLFLKPEKTHENPQSFKFKTRCTAGRLDRWVWKPSDKSDSVLIDGRNFGAYTQVL